MADQSQQQQQQQQQQQHQQELQRKYTLIIEETVQNGVNAVNFRGLLLFLFVD